jgi:spore coat protein A, manganese oxidase
MASQDRRDFLKLCVASAPALLLADHGRQDKSPNSSLASGSWRAPASVDRYIDPLPIPKQTAPSGIHKDVAEYRVHISEFTRQIHSQLPPTKLWGFEGQYPGPTFEARCGQAIVVEWQNHLPREHLFAIDPHIHGAMPPVPAVRTVPHLHGSRSPSPSDGLPEKWFVPGQSVRYFYPNSQQAATLWYHDHAVGITRLNVYAGLSGFYFLRDNNELAMDLPSGRYEIPLLLQDRTLDAHGQLIYSPSFEDGQIPPPGTWAPEFFGELPVVNGAIYPYLAVEPRPYRLRVLNGANSRFFNLYFNLAKSATDIPSLVRFYQIGSDGGFLPRPVSLNHVLLGPAERADLIVDFSGLEEKTVTLSNNAAVPYPGWTSLKSHHAPLYELMQFRVELPGSVVGRSMSLPKPIVFPSLDLANAAVTRNFVLSEQLDAQGRSLGVRINNKGYDDPVTEKVKLGSTEKWCFINTTDDAHPMHLHLVQFRILQRQGFDTAALGRGVVRLIGIPRAPDPNEAGWKDTAVVQPGEILIILVRFEGYAGRYVFHCHMLEHEDNDMMRPYEVVA